MPTITLVLPFALPPAELAPDLIKALDAPALASLLGKSSRETLPAADGARVLPHEQWLAQQALGSSGWAGALRAAFGIEDNGGNGSATWWLLHPAHIEITRSSLLLNDLRRLGLTEPHGRALFDSVQPLFHELGLELRYGDAATWLLRADAWAGLDTASPDAAAGMDVTTWLPKGDTARAYRKLQNEVQMLWHEHPANVERAAMGKAPANALWLWGASSGTVPQTAPALWANSTAPWLRPLLVGAPDIEHLCQQDNAVVVCDELAQAGVASDWSAWLYHMSALDRELFQPLLAALRAKRVTQAELLLGDRERLVRHRITPMGLHAFWRSPGFKALLS
jgi:hypothetical protein